MKKKNIWKRTTAWMKAFLILALVFLAVGLGTLGSTQSTKDGFVLSSKREGDTGDPAIVYYLPDRKNTEMSQLYIKHIYLNVGTIYNEVGKVATVSLKRSTTGGTNSYYSDTQLKIANFYEELGENGKTVNPLTGALYNWVEFDLSDTNGLSSSYVYFKLTADCDVLINEIVFVANNREDTGEPVVVKAEIDTSSVFRDESDKEKARATLDKQEIPSLAQSSFYRFGDEEVYTLMTISEMRRGEENAPGEVYHGDRVYGALGTDLIALATSVFGISPFGLRLLPMLAAFGVLVFGFLFVRKLLKSDRAGFVFAAIYALCGMSVCLAHLGTPLMIGLCFFMIALYTCGCFFTDGMKQAKMRAALPLLFSGLFSAAAICVHSAFLIPVAGIVALFVAGMVRQQQARRYYLDKAIAEAEEEERAPEFLAAAGDDGESHVSEGRKKVAKVLSEYRYKNRLAPALFFAFLIFGAFLLAILSLLPADYTLVKLYADAASRPSVFLLGWKSFAGGFAGSNPVGNAQSAWSSVYVLFRGTGDAYAVTATGLLMTLAAVVAGLIGVVLVMIHLAKNMKTESFRSDIRTTIVLLFGASLSLITASFAPGALGFLFLAYLFLFAIAAYAFHSALNAEGRAAKGMKIFSIAWLAVLVVCFALFAVFTFSIPTAGFLAGLFA